MYWKYDTAFFRNYQFWDEIWHLGGQIKMKMYSNPIIPIYHFDMRSGIWGDRSNIGGADQHENLKMFIQISQLFILRWNQAYKGSDQALVQINVPRYLFEIHYLLSSHQFGKGTVDMDFSLLLHTSTKGTMMLLSWSGLSKSPPWSPWGPRSGRPHSSKESSTTCCYLPPLLSETRDHLWYNVIASWIQAQSVLYRCNSQRRLGGFEAVQLWSHKSTFKIYLKSQILNLFGNVQHFKSIWNVFLNFCLKPEITFDTKSLLHEHLHRVFWLFTNPANGCLLTAIHPLPFSMTNIAMYSKCWPVSIISDCSQYKP